MWDGDKFSFLVFFFPFWLSMFSNVSTVDMYCFCHNRIKQEKLLKKKGQTAVLAGKGLPGKSLCEGYIGGVLPVTEQAL